ncbi:MAG: sortase [Bacilli bacterium]|nr:sortase [Bacilli bacterium]
MLLIVNFSTIRDKKIEKTIYQKSINNPKNTIYSTKQKKLLTIVIPKINLEKNIYPINSSLNNLGKNIKILPYSDISTNSFILASHSGNNSNAYFNNITLLNNSDLIYIYLKDNIYTYKVINKHYINKTGYLEITESRINKLILVTCSRTHKDKQLIIISKLVNINKK